MSELVIAEKTDLVNIADAVRSNTGRTQQLSLSGITDEINYVGSEIDNQASLISQISTALEGKAAGGGDSGGGDVEICTVSFAGDMFAGNGYEIKCAMTVVVDGAIRQYMMTAGDFSNRFNNQIPAVKGSGIVLWDFQGWILAGADYLDLIGDGDVIVDELSNYSFCVIELTGDVKTVTINYA